MKRIAIVGGGIAGLTAAYELAQRSRNGAPVEAVLFEASACFGGIVETIREGGFTIETGPDAWVTAKPHARDLAIELGLESELIASNDATRKTHIFLATPGNPSGSLIPMPDGLHMMVPSDLQGLTESPLFTAKAIAAYRAEPARAAELLASIPAHDESVADFTLRHFGPEVLTRLAAPLLSGVFGGDVHKLSVRAVMPAFVEMERNHGSLIAALQHAHQPATDNLQPVTGIFTTLRSGLGTLIDRLVAAIPPHWLRPQTCVNSISCPNPPNCSTWNIHTNAGSDSFDEIFLATPLDITRNLLASIDSTAAALLPTESSSAVLVAFGYSDATRIPLPPGFGFLVPPAAEPGGPSFPVSSERMGYRAQLDRPLPLHANRKSVARVDGPLPASLLLACTFTDQKFPHRVSPGGRLIRAFFGGTAADRIARCNNDEIAAIARLELARILNTTVPITAAAPTPAPPPAITVVRRWPNSLPQYAVGHPARIAELESRLRTTVPGLTILGNATHGVGLPDLIRQSRAAARVSAGE
jgi:oxygen-dependent protoporphyrinogen oxidase